MKILIKKIKQAGASRTFGIGRRLLSLLLSLVLLVGLVPAVTVPAKAAGNGQFILRVGTGENSGKNVACFGIRYREDKDGKQVLHTQYIYPQEGDANDIFKAAGDVNALNNRVKILKNISGYTINNHENGFSVSGSSDGVSLQSHSTDYFLFEPLHPFDELVDIYVCMFYDQDRRGQPQQWDCTKMDFIEVSQFRGVNVEGYLSGRTNLSFSGYLLAELDKKQVNNQKTLTLSQSDWIIRCRDYDLPLEYHDRGAQPIDDERNSTYLFELDFADVYGGGIETLAAKYGAGQCLKDVVEVLTLAVEYKDADDYDRTVWLPVITSSLTLAVESGLVEEWLPIVGVAQQGERLFFKGFFPNFKKFTKFTLIYGHDSNGTDAATKAGLELKTPSTGQSDRLKDRQQQSDTFNLAAFKVYPGDTKVTRDRDGSPASLRLQVDANAMPICQFGSGNYEGVVITDGEKEIVTSTNEPEKTTRGAGKGIFIVSITTDNVALAATSDDVLISLQYRSSLTGNLLKTQNYSLKENVREYPGYWPGKEKVDDVAYRYAVSPGKTLEFAVSIDNVDAFVGATLTIKSVPGKKIDDWQMSSLTVKNYADPGERRAYWTNALSYTDRIFERDIVTGTTVWAQYPNAVDLKEAEEDGVRPAVYLCADTPSVTIAFNNEGRSAVAEEEERDWEALRYSMTIADAHQNLKFKEPMCEYTVNVKVANNSSEGLGDNGDAGSGDLFYFMLDFRNGSSAYVLANQQLESDAFRSGVTEAFSIKTNRDYGPLVSVHIIPEHSTDDNQFDKLNIESITVTKKSNEGISKMWKIENVGWVGSDYFDKGAESSVRGRPGRSESEVAQVFPVTEEGYVANILFAMKTGPYNGLEQLRGIMSVKVDYYNANGEWNTYSCDVVEKMYEYAGITTKKCNVTGETKNKAELDPAFMVRENMTDRFILSIENLRQIVRVTFTVRGENTTKWDMAGLSIYTIESVGLLQINASGEYQRSNKVTLLATSNEGKQINVPAGAEIGSSHGTAQSVEVSMGEHKIEVDLEEAAWSSTITREPLSNDDSLNVYIYTKKAIPSSDMGNYTMDMAVTCDLAYNNGIYQVSQTGMAPVAGGTMFYATDIPARGISGVKTLTLGANARNEYVALDRAVVQHIRSGVTINTYTFNLNSSTAARQDSFTPSTSTASGSQQQKQVLKLFFAEDTEEQMIEKEANDLVVAIRYNSANDAQRTGQQTNGGGTLYNSKYIYLSDLKQAGTESQKYNAIKPGMIAEIEFNEAYVGDITGISLVSTGSLRAHIQSACIQSESTLSGKTETQWYNFADDIYVDNVPQMMSKSTWETVVPVRMTFNTEDGAINMGTNAGFSDTVPIRMEVFYHDNLTNTVESMTIEDLNAYLTEGGFQSGDTATVEFFLENMNSIRYITLEPHSIYSSSAAWKLKSVNCETWKNGVPNRDYRLKTVNQEILQGNPITVNLSTVIVQVTTEVYSEVTKTSERGQTNSSVDNPVLPVTLKPGRAVTILPEVFGTLDGYGYTVLAVRGESVFSGEKVTCYRIVSDGTQVVFTPPIVETNVTYAIRIASEEMPDSYCDVIVTVEGAPKVEGNEDRAPVNSSGTKEEKNDDGEDADEGGSGEGGTPPETPPEA